MRFSDIEKNYEFNHEYGDCDDNKRNDGRRRTNLFKFILLYHKKHATNEDMLDGDTLITRLVGLSGKETN